MNFSTSIPPSPGIGQKAVQPPVQPDSFIGATGGPQPQWAQQPWDPVEAVLSLFKAWKPITIFVALSLAVTSLVLASWPRTYTAAALVLLDPRNQPNLQLDQVLAGIAPDDQTISSEVLVLQSADLASKVITDLSLANDPEFYSASATGLRFWRTMLPAGVRERVLGKTEASGAAVPEAALDAAEVRVLQAFADRLDVAREGRSYAIRLSFAAGAPEKSADIVNRLAERYLEDQLSVKFAAHGVAQDWLNQRVAELQENVEAAEQAVEAYRSRSGLIDSKGLTIAGQQMGEINTRLIAARADTAAARARLAQIKGLVAGNGDALSAAEVLSSPLIHRLKEQEVEVLRRRADLSQEFGPKHPRMLSVQAELADIRDRILGEVRQIVAGLKNEVAVAVAQEDALATDLARLEGQTAEQNKAEVQLRALEREAEASRNLLETFLARIKETSNQEAIQRSDARILSAALPPVKHSSPREILVLAAVAFGSLLAASLCVLMLNVRRLSAGDLATFRSQTGIRVLACVPRISRWQGRRQTVLKRLLALERAAALTAAGLGSAKTVMVAPVDAEDRSADAAIALAKIYARQERDVLLIDGHFEGGRLSAKLGLQGATGLAEVLTRSDIGPLPSAPSGIDRLRILSAGQCGDAPKLLLDPAALAAKWAHIQAACMQIVLHSGPVLGSVESRMFAGQCDAVVLVVRFGNTPPHLIREAATMIREAGGVVAGAVLVDANVEATAPSRARIRADAAPLTQRWDYGQRGI